jgi:hypothetical protein
MIWVVRYLPALAVAGALGFSGWTVWGWKVDRDAALADLASVERSLAAIKMERDQAKEARAVADAARARVEQKAAEYDQIREAILKGEDDEIPDWMLAHLFDLGVVRRGGAD